MKNKARKIFLILLAFIVLSLLSFYLYSIIITSGYNLNNELLLKPEREIIYLDVSNQKISNYSETNNNVQYNDLPEYLIKAFISIEDKNFFNHKGVDVKGIFRALYNNVTTLSFKEGASTISQQLIKNTHLTNEKTLKRKLIEIKLAKKLEKKYSKKDIMQMYLNTIYFGENCYGIYSASMHYFHKEPKDLSLNECAMLAGIVKAPTMYSPNKNYDKCIERKNIVLLTMKKNSYIDENKYNELKNEKIEITKNVKKYDYMYLLNREIDTFIDKNPYYNGKIYVKTFYNQQIQELLENNQYLDEDKNYSSVIFDKENNLVAYLSNCTEQKRQIGSTIKPLLVYAPALDKGLICEDEFILDEKTTFNDYTPSNFGDKYYGNVSIKDSLIKSLNVPAVKLLNTIGIKNAKNYINKTDIKLCDKDNSLSIALGGTTFGYSLYELTNSYNVFVNNGYYIKPRIIEKVSTDKNNILLNNQRTKEKVYDKDTVEIINDILKNTKESGTGKQLKSLKFDLCCKTGTVGNKNGNTDAYCISYTTDYTLGVWLGSKEKVLNNSFTGGNEPSKISKNIWENIYENNYPANFSKDDIIEKYIDKIDYNENHTLILADDNAPERYKMKCNFSYKNIPLKQSKRFTNPKIENAEISVNINELNIKLCQTEYYDFKLYNIEENKEEVIYDTKGKNSKSINVKLNYNKEYLLKIVPYFIKDDFEYIGEGYYLNKIKTPAEYAGDDWWDII